jgi:hypothetical protein
MIKSRKTRAMFAALSLVGVGSGMLIATLATTPEKRFSNSPDGAYYATVNIRFYETVLPRMPGDERGMPAFVAVYTRGGDFCGRAKVPLLWMVDEFEWSTNTAGIRVVAEWDLVNRSVSQMSE